MSFEHGESFMRNVYKWILGTVIVAGLGLTTACGNRGKGGGGGGTAAPGVGIGGIGVDQWGNPIIPGGGSGYVGQGNFYGSVTTQDPNAYREMLQMLGMCWGVQCNYVSNYMYLTINLQSDWMPSPGVFSVRASSNGAWGQERRFRGDAYATGANNGTTVANGFIIVHTPFGTQSPMFGGMGLNYGYPYQNIPSPGINGVNGTNNTLQIIATFTGGNRSLVNVQLLFRGRPVASGVLRAQMLNGANCNGGVPCTGTSMPLSPTTYPNQQIPYNF